MRQNIKKSLEEKLWKTGEGNVFLYKTIGDYEIRIEYHRIRGYSLLVLKDGKQIGDNWISGYLEDTLKVGQTLEQILFSKSGEAPEMTEIPEATKPKKEVVVVKQRGRPRKVNIATVS